MEEVFLPQMTFKVECQHLIKVIKNLLNVPIIENEKARTIKKTLNNFYQDIVTTETCVQKLFENMEDSEDVQKSKVYLFLILYKLSVYVYVHENIMEGKYLKDYISFLSRHSNLIFYQRILELIGKEKLYSILNQPDIIKMIYPKKHKAPVTSNVDPNDFGDPTKSFMGYFEFMETPIEGELEEWLMYKKIDGYTAQYELENDLIMMENRLFHLELLEVLKNKKIVKDKFLNFRKIPDILKGLEHVNMIDQIYNPKSKRYVKKCEKGYIRTRKFKCVKNSNSFKELIKL